jgi:hypothetical protein
MAKHTYRLYIAAYHNNRIDWKAETVRGSVGISKEEGLALINEFKSQTSSETADPKAPTIPGVNIKRLNKRYSKWMVVLD